MTNPSVRRRAVDDPLRELKSSRGMTLEEHSQVRPQLVVFLRHFGCTFCREALADLAVQRAEIERRGFDITLVHMVDDREAERFFSSYGLGDLTRVSDAGRRMYEMFGLDRGSLGQLFGLRVWFRGLIAGLFAGHGLGTVRGNPFQMPGVFVLDRGKLVSGFQHRVASDRPDYLGLICQAEAIRGAETFADLSGEVEAQPLL